MKQFYNMFKDEKVVIELKVTAFKIEYISQVQKYMNYVEKNIKGVSNNATIGILICKRENSFIIEYVQMKELLLENINLCDIINIGDINE